MKKKDKRRMLFRNMGLFWKRADVFWGKQKNRGKLLGIPKNAKRSDKIDFWNQVGVYALYSNFKLVYVGQARSPHRGIGARLRNHTTDNLAGRWDTFSWFGLCWIKMDGELATVPRKKSTEAHDILDMVEGILIEASEPPLNRQGARFGNNVDRFLQFKDERIEGDS